MWLFLIHTGVGVWTVWTVVTGGVGAVDTAAVTVTGVVVAVVIVAATVYINKKNKFIIFYLKLFKKRNFYLINLH